MRVTVKVGITLVVLLVGVFAGSYYLGASAEDTMGLPEGVGTGKVLGFQNFSLKSGVNPKDFEKFVAEEWYPVIKDRIPGVQLTLMKGERGTKVGHYIVAYEMNSLYVRDYYWPKSGEASEALKAAEAKCGEAWEKVWNKFMTYAERTEWTDYVALVKQ